MKKTVIAAALASTVFSGAAMAWSPGALDSSVEIGGNIQVTPFITPWEVEVGASVSDLHANITKGVKVVDIPVTKAIPILGIRTATKDAFMGQVAGSNISPQIDFHGAVKLNGFVKNTTTLDLPVVDADNPTTRIGKMETEFTSAAQVSWKRISDSYSEQNPVWANVAGEGFFGGAPTITDITPSSGGETLAIINSISPSYAENYLHQDGIHKGASTAGFSNTGASYSGVYGSGILAGSNIKVTLDTPMADEAIKWKASMPVTVTYQ
ncbi:hypothetical protein JNC30_004677 [Salmonella enterica]|nr:hypothetical protein [Salmonella enterica]EGM3389989.1 hypothetical protein [Salmonella enterica]EHE3387887.1 hypothetical protein [Salmonella enterica]